MGTDPYTKKITMTGLAVVSGLTGIIMIWRFYGSPFFRRRDFERNSAFANYVYDEERKLKEDSSR